MDACGAVVKAAVEALAAFVADLDVSCWHGDDAATVVKFLARGERVCAAGKALLACRVADTGAHARDGQPDPAKWLARESGTTTAEAHKTLETAGQLDDLPGTDAAYRAGELSDDQVNEITSAATADPTAEETLLAEAARQPVAQLRKTCQRIRAAATGDTAVKDRNTIHASRYLRTWTTKDGAYEGRFRLTTDAGATLAAALDHAHDQAFERARVDGTRPSYEQLEADALTHIATLSLTPTTDPTTTPGPVATIHFRVDHSAFLRGHTIAGETSEADGIGPVPVATIRKAASDAIFRALLVDGDTVLDARHAGRAIPARIRQALVARDRTCVIPGCPATRHLEIHHLDPIANNGPTSMANTCRICSTHHDQITYRGATLTGTHPHWTWTPP